MAGSCHRLGRGAQQNQEPRQEIYKNKKWIEKSLGERGLYTRCFIISLNAYGDKDRGHSKQKNLPEEPEQEREHKSAS